MALAGAFPLSVCTFLPILRSQNHSVLGSILLEPHILLAADEAAGDVWGLLAVTVGCKCLKDALVLSTITLSLPPTCSLPRSFCLVYSQPSPQRLPSQQRPPCKRRRNAQPLWLSRKSILLNWRKLARIRAHLQVCKECSSQELPLVQRSTPIIC